MARALVIAAAALLLALSPMHAAPRSISDCERIKEADAYNRCLAEFGPAFRGGGPSRPPPREADAAPAATGHAGRPAARRGGRAKPPWLAARQAEGRRRMEERRRRHGVMIERKGARVRAVIDLKGK